MKRTTFCATVIVLLTASIGLANLTDGLKAYYPFNGNANDASGNGNHGVEKGGPSYVAGVCAQAISLDGEDDYIRIPHSESLAFSSAITISIWLKSSYQGQSYIMNNFDVSGDSTKWAFDLTGKQGSPTYSVAFAVWGQSGVPNDNKEVISYAPDVWNNQWYHIAATYDQKSIKLYIDGNLSATELYDKLINFTTADILIGVDLVGGRFPMELDELKIYNRALTAQEIRQHVIPAPGALVLGGIGVSFVGWLRRRKAV
jgi:hypothetical protein